MRLIGSIAGAESSDFDWKTEGAKYLRMTPAQARSYAASQNAASRRGRNDGSAPPEPPTIAQATAGGAFAPQTTRPWADVFQTLGGQVQQ